MQAADASWWLVFLAYRNFGGAYHHLGRETFLAPVEWKVGEWPVVATAKTNGATNNFAGLAIGLALVLIHLACIRYTGTSVNPARSIGPALFQGGTALANLWIFIVGPFAGGALAAGIWKMIDTEK